MEIWDDGQRDKALSSRLVYDARLFSAERAQRLVQHFLIMAEAMVAGPDIFIGGLHQVL